MKVFDSFIFFNELDLLEMRLNILNDVVDHFVLTESPFTVSGNEKPLYYQENKDRFGKFNDKIVHYVTEEIPNDFSGMLEKTKFHAAYKDPDPKDIVSWHLTGHMGDELLATMRVVPPGISYDECSIGRVAVSGDYRNRGLGRDLMNTALAFCDSRWTTVRLSAQCYLQDFYESLDFATDGEPYLEDNIPHIEMVRQV